VNKTKHTTAERPPASHATDLERNPHLFKQVLNASGVAMVIRDSDLRPIFANQAFTDFYEYSAEELRGMRLVDLLPENTLVLHTDTIKPTVLSGSSWEGEYTIRTKGGRLHTVWGRFDPVIDATGTITHAISIMQDASTSMSLRNALTQTERHLRFLADNTSDCLFRLRLSDGRFDYISSAAESITGYTPREFYNTPMSFKKLIPNDWSDTFELWWDEFLAGKSRHTYESPLKNKDGSLHWVNQRISVITDDNGQPVAIEGIASDITERKRAEEALLDSEERYRVLVENAQEGVVVTQDGITKYINEGMTNILGYSAEDLKQIHPLEMAHPEDKAIALEQLNSFVSGKKKDGFASFRVITRYAQIKWLTLTVKPIMWEGFPAQLEILTDVTVYKALEKELRTAHGDMENRINKRTTELSKANIQLKTEAKEREKAQEHIQSLTQQLIRIQEDERKRIARDLHDNVAQDLSSTVLQMETLFDGHPQTDNGLFERGKAVAKILRGTIASVRDIAYGLRPPALDQLGLVQALENHCHDTEDRVGIAVDFYTAGIENIQLDFDTEINIYRMVQEAISNMTKHANASKATVRLVKSHPDLLVRIEDNGQGFEIKKRMEEAAEEKRMGLRSMEERARLIGGSMEIQSLIGTGTRIIFKIPIKNARRRGQYANNDRR